MLSSGPRYLEVVGGSFRLTVASQTTRLAHPQLQVLSRQPFGKFPSRKTERKGLGKPVKRESTQDLKSVKGRAESGLCLLGVPLYPAWHASRFCGQAPGEGCGIPPLLYAGKV